MLQPSLTLAIKYAMNALKLLHILTNIKSLCWSKLSEQVQKMAWACGFVIISIYTLLRILNMWPFVLFLICYAVTSQNKKIYYISKTFSCTQTLKQLQDTLSIIRQGVCRLSKPLHLMLNLKRNGYAMTVIYHYSKELLENTRKKLYSNELK